MIYEGLVDADRVNSLISSAAKHKIQELKLSVTVKPLYVLPNCFSTFGSLNNLDLQLVCVLDVASGIHFPSLKTLKLLYVTFANGKSVQQLFSGCPVLQELNLYKCDWESIKQITIKFPTLKILSISDYYRPDNNKLNSTVKSDAVNLSSFRCKYQGSVEFALVSSPSIVDAHIEVKRLDLQYPEITGRLIFKHLSGLGSIKYLLLTTGTLKCLSFTKSSLHLLPMFTNLTHLHVSERDYPISNEALMDILQKTPKLEVLDIPMGFDPPIWILNSTPFCFKYSLKEFSISNFYEGEAEIQLLKLMLENFSVLEEIRIFCSKALSTDLKKQAEISSQLQPIVMKNCVIKFL